MKIRHYVTLFNSRYLLRGLALYESLCANTENFILYIIAFDDDCYNKLIELKLKNAKIVSLSEFEDSELLSVKNSRSVGEYCWTSTAKSILYVFDNTDCDDCTYLDSDIYFFNNPEVLISEVPENKSVLITEHKYTKEYDQTEVSGKYCVQFMYFKRDKNGLEVLNWWKDRCIEWCYAQPEDGKLGDQKYLDDWMNRFEGVYELKNLGGGMAPWNIQQYIISINDNNNKLEYLHKDSQDIGKIIFYHFHRMEFFEQDVVRLTSGYYRLPSSAVAYIYKEYVRKCDNICKKYNLNDKKNIWRNESVYNSDIDELFYDKNFFRYSMFI